MLISSDVLVKWNSKNIKWYSEKGYKYTHIGNTFSVHVDDLPNYCRSSVVVKCDYCGKVFQQQWGVFRKGRLSGLGKDSCNAPSCTGSKSADVMQLKHGVRYSAYLPETIAKRKETCLQRYGAENPFASEMIKEKIMKINMQKFGVPYTQQAPEVRAKTEKTCMERYGVKNYVEKFAGTYIGADSPRWKGGAEYSRVERATHDYIVWRKNIFDKDKYSCQKCGIKNGNGTRVELNAHHIFNWSDNIDKRYDVNNGITLCSRCHSAFHSRYGKHNNTKEQLDEFLTDEKIC